MKLISDAQDIERLAGGYVVANTPVSLLLWLQRDPTVLRVAATNTESEMLDDIYPVLREKRTEVATAIAYALLVAIGARRRESGGSFARPPFELTALVWGQAIWERMGRAAIPTQTILIGQRIESPSVTQHGDSGAALSIVGPDGQPLRLTRG